MSTAVAELDDLFRALASEPRRRIVDHLTAGPTTTPRLGEHFRFSKQALNRHLVTLEDAGLVERSRVGRVDRVALVPDRLDGLTRWVDQVQLAWEDNLDRLGAVLAELEATESETNRETTTGEDPR